MIITSILLKISSKFNLILKDYNQLYFKSHVCQPSINYKLYIRTRGNHWIVASTILSSPGIVTVYDTLYDTVDSDTADVILNLFGRSNHLKINMATIQKQVDVLPSKNQALCQLNYCK